MSWKGFLKLFTIGVLALALSIALFAVMDLIADRTQTRAEVYDEIAKSTAGAQIVAGPLLVLPYELHKSVSTIDEHGIRKTSLDVTQHQQLIMPRELSMKGELKVESRFRNLYEILLYGTELTLAGDFDFSDFAPDIEPGVTLKRLTPYLVVLVQDTRGITSVPVALWDESPLAVQPGHRGLKRGIEGGFHAELPRDVYAGGRHRFSILISLKGMQALSWIPAGDITHVALKANWPHPSFQGRSLPTQRTITPQGFEAEWNSTQFSTQISQLLANPTEEASLKNQEVGVGLIQPVDIYRQTVRSVKYGFLIIALTFFIFLSFESLKGLSIHPIQYAFVSLAVIIFYVLLLALSEHISFAWAYLVATLASVSLLGFYLRYVLHSWKDALSFALSLATLDLCVYGILSSEDFALLYGACLLFGILATAMIITRRVNWAKEQISHG